MCNMWLYFSSSYSYPMYYYVYIFLVCMSYFMFLYLMLSTPIIVKAISYETLMYSLFCNAVINFYVGVQ
jgi:hypothetical protein